MPDAPQLNWLISLALERFWGVGLALTFASWFSALVGAIIYYRWQRKAPEGERGTVRNFLRFCFPASILTSRTLRTDIGFALLIKVFDLVALAPLLVGGGVMAAYVDYLATLTFGVRERTEPGVLTWLLMIAAVIVVQDFVIFIRHYGEHRIRLLWEFHKVHHSPEDLFPTANRRHHPFERFFEAATNTAGAGIFIGLASYVLHVPLVDTVFFGVDAIYLLDLLSFYHLRHSHVALSFGKLEKYFLSPAQHHLHHSCEVRDWDVNFGTILAVWDRMFGTIRYTDHSYRFERGLVREERADYDNLFKLMVVPVWRAGGLIAGWARSPWRRHARTPQPSVPQDRTVEDKDAEKDAMAAA